MTEQSPRCPDCWNGKPIPCAIGCRAWDECCGKSLVSPCERCGGTGRRGFPFLISVASQSWRGVTSGESKKDHGCTEEDYNGANGVTLCGRKMGMRWFPRQERFTGEWSFHCERCVRAAVKRGLLDPTKLDQKFKSMGIGVI